MESTIFFFYQESTQSFKMGSFILVQRIFNHSNATYTIHKTQQFLTKQN